MLKQSAPTMPGMTDTLDFVKNLWGSMNIPGANMPGMSGLAGPPLSVEDLDKRIADMKAVESWLNLNLTMLRGTIQALEVQRGTLATLRSMGASMAEAMRQSGVSAEKMAGMPFGPFFGQPAPGASPAAKPPSATGAAGPAAGGGSAQPGAPASGPAQAPFDPVGGAAALGMPAAMAWWNMLQDQFTQAVATAMTPAPTATAATPPQDTAPDAGAKARPDNPPPQAQAAPPMPSDEPAGGGNGNGNGRARGGRPKADKG